MAMPDQTTGALTSACPIKVAIIEDHQKFRECLEFLLNNTAGYRCIASFRSMEEALAKINIESA